MKFIARENKEMSNGNRDMSRTILTDKEIEFVKSEIRRIGADESRFVFNDEAHIQSSTCYNFITDLIYVTRNVFSELCLHMNIMVTEHTVMNILMIIKKE